MQKLDPNESSYVVIVTRGHRDDMRILRWAVQSRARYVGMIGSKRKVIEIFKALQAEGIPAHLFDRVHAPIGLDIGAIRTIALGSTTSTLGVLSRGEIDAALLPYPVALRSIRRDQSLLLLSDFVRWQDGVVFASSATIAARRDLIARFMRAYQRGTADYELNFLSYDDAGDFIPGPRYDEYLHALARQLQVAPDFLSMTKAYCDRRANLDLADIEKQLRFWQGQGRLDPRIATSDLVDPSFIGEETVAPQTSRP